MVRIVADSTCDISKETRDRLGVTTVPLKVNFDDGVYRDGIDLSVGEFYAKLSRVSKLPTTSQVNPSEFEEVFRKITEKGDEVVCICISRELSGTLSSALTAAEAVDPSRIFCVDTRCATFGAYLIINEAVKMRSMGISAKEIAENAQSLADRVRLFAMVDTLKYLKMGGRVSGTAAAIGEILGIHPIIQVKGSISVLGKARGYKAAFSKLLESFLAEPADLSHGVAFGHSYSPQRLKELMSLFEPYIRGAEVLTGDVGPVIGSHVGPGALGVAYIAKQSR